jgi:bromodomain-containing protein 7/9
VPGYSKIITHPMDFLTMENKINAGEYLEVSGFLHDFRLIMSNCREYNEPGSIYYKQAYNLGKIGEKYIAKEARNVEGYVELEDSREEFEETVNGMIYVLTYI